MNRARSHFLALAMVAGLVVPGFVASGPVAVAETSNPGSNSKPLHAVTQIECITPDGHVSPVADAEGSALNAPATIKDDETISCPLREGKTIFIITFSRIALLDRFTFVNENAAAHGELEIAVSNSLLPADSPAWTAVDGVIPFARKRLFNLSMIGVEARYVKLSFRVESSTATANRDNPVRSASRSAGFRFGYVQLDVPSALGASRD